MLSGKTWAERAWCRAERVARELACSSGFPFAVESTTHVTLVNQQLGFLCPPGEGHLSFDEDRQKLATIMVQLIWNKLSHCLMQGDLHSYRLILNQQDARLKNLDTRPVDLAIPGFNPRENPDDDPEGFTLANFMHQNGFETISQRDESGWTPLCYAAMNGDTCIIAALLKRRADPNEKVTKKDPKAYVQKNTSAVSICAWFGRNEALKLLLSARAHPDALSGLKQTALEWACCGNNVEGVRLLLDARADHTIQNIMGCTPFQAGCCMGSVDTMQAMLEHAPGSMSYSVLTFSNRAWGFWGQGERAAISKVSPLTVSQWKSPGQILQHSLHFSLLLGEGSGQAVCMLLQSRADVNERCNFFKTKTYGWWALLKSLSLAHSAGYTSKLRKLAYHHHGATPLMFSVLAGTFEATYALLRAGARTDLRNGRGKVVLDLAREIGATDLMKALEAASLPSLASPLSAPSASWETQDPLMAESF